MKIRKTTNVNFIYKFEDYINKRIKGNSDITIKIGKSPIFVGHDSKLLSKVYENYVVELLKRFCKDNKVKFRENTIQNRYPDFVVYTKCGKPIAIDIKTSYLKSTSLINGFTLGTYRGYFSNRGCSKNTMYPYSQFLNHLCICVIYSREKTKVKIRHIVVREKWRIASRCTGSGNTCNIGSIKKIRDILDGCSVFRNKMEFEKYWINK